MDTTESKLNMIIDTLRSIETRISNIETNMARIDENSKSVEKDCMKMREHITFIEDTYSVVRLPLNFIKNKVEYIMGKQIASTDLPMIENETQPK